MYILGLNAYHGDALLALSPMAKLLQPLKKSAFAASSTGPAFHRKRFAIAFRKLASPLRISSMSLSIPIRVRAF